MWFETETKLVSGLVLASLSWHFSFSLCVCLLHMPLSTKRQFLAMLPTSRYKSSNSQSLLSISCVGGTILSISHTLIYLILAITATESWLTHELVSLWSRLKHKAYFHLQFHLSSLSISQLIFWAMLHNSTCGWLPFHQLHSSEPFNCEPQAGLLSLGQRSEASYAYEWDSFFLRSCRRGRSYWHL